MSTNKVVALASTPLPTKLCKACGNHIQVTRRASGVWDQIEYCCAACRRFATSARARAPKVVAKSSRIA